MKSSKWFLIILTACLGYFPTASAETTCSSISSACAHLSAACEELSGLYEEDSNCLYLPVDKCACWGTLNFYAEYLWWHIFQEQLHFAVTGVQNNVPGEGELIAFQGDWDSGFRIGAAVLFPCNAWRLSLDWLRFSQDEEKGATPSGLTLRATRGHPGDIDILTSTAATFDFQLDSIRLGLQVPLFTRTHVAIKPIIALRADRITEDFNVLYVGTESGFFQNKLRYWGIGPEAGLEANWYILPCFSLFGEATIAGLYGNYDVHQRSQDNDADEDVNMRNRYDRMQAAISSQLGVQWEGVFFRCLYFGLRLGWETNVWFNLNTTYSFTDTVVEGNLIDSSGDLRTNGVTFRATLSF